MKGRKKMKSRNAQRQGEKLKRNLHSTKSVITSKEEEQGAFERAFKRERKKRKQTASTQRCLCCCFLDTKKIFQNKQKANTTYKQPTNIWQR